METDLNDVRVFARVVDAKSFTAAARASGVPTSTISRRIARLEERLGVRLLNRTTRRLSLTDAGRVYHERCARIVEELEDADRAVAEMQSAPKGRLRVTAPSDLTGQMWGLMSTFLSEYPDVQLEIYSAERYVNLVEEGFDVALRGGPRPDTQSFIARKLSDSRRVLVASPAYIAEHGQPARAQDLRDHRCVIFTPWAPHGNWTLRGSRGKKVQVAVTGRVAVNEIGTARRAALDGMGIAQLLTSVCHEDIDRGTLVELLPGVCPPADALWVIYPSRRHIAPTVRAFVDYVIANVHDHLDLDAPSPAR